jgi:hypothetical protein
VRFFSSFGHTPICNGAIYFLAYFLTAKNGFVRTTERKEEKILTYAVTFNSKMVMFEQLKERKKNIVTF